jgi:2-deoxy-D-gluconate 3-dehydrogenase
LTPSDLRSLFGLGGRSVLVTGASRGLGRAMAIAIAAAGATVVAVSRTARDLDPTAQDVPGGRILPLPWDVSELDAADDLVTSAEELAGPLFGVVHAAGVQHRAPAIEVGVEDWRRVTTLDLDAPFFLSTAMHRRQHRAGRAGSHVFVGSLTSHIGIAGISPYAASKSGLCGVVRTLAVEWAPTGARVNGLAPGYFRTALTANLLDDPERGAWVRSRIPMGRLGTGDDLAGAAIFLLAEASAYMTGQMITVDGGWTAG